MKIVLGTVMLFLSCIFGCHKENDDNFQKITINLQADPTSLHPHFGIDLSCRCIQKSLFEGLTRLNLNNEPELAAAEKVDISENRRIYTFTLRPLKWSNGQEVTAFQFESAWKRGIAKNSPCLRADLFYVIKNAKKAKLGEVTLDEVGIFAKDAKTLVVELEYPAPYFLDLIANPLFVPLYNEDEVPSCFNGPFLLKKWKHDNLLQLVANPTYWDAEHIQLKVIDFTVVKEPHTALLMYEKGEIDFIGGPFTKFPIDAIPEFEKKGILQSQAIVGIYWYCCNTKCFPLSSPSIRKALSYAINREELSHYVLQGEIPCLSVIPPKMKEIKEPSLSGEKSLALKYFEEGLKELNLTKETFPPLELSYSDISGQKSLSEAVAREWEKTFGIKVELSGSEWNSFFSNLVNRQFQIGGAIMYHLYNDPSYSLEFFKDPDHRYNSPQWENQRYSELVELAQNELNLDKRKHYLQEAEQILLNEMPIIPIFICNNRYLLNEKIKNLYFSDLGFVDFKWAHVEYVYR